MSEALKTVPPGMQDGELDLGGIGRALARRKKLIAGATLGSALAAFAFVTLVTPKYTGEAKVLIENQETYFTRPDKSVDAGAAIDEQTVASQVQLVTSRDLAREAIRKLGLMGNSEFDPMAGGMGALSRVLVLAGLKRAPADMSPEERILETYFENLQVFPVPKSRVLQIEFKSKDPDLAARAANTIAELYISVQQKTKRDSAKASAASLGALTTDLRNRLADAESKSETFRASAGIFLGGSNNTPLSSQQLSDMSGQLATARTAQADAQAKSRLLREMIRAGRLNDVSDIAKDDLVRRYSEQRVTLRGVIALESRNLLPGHPRIKELNAQLGELETDLKAAAEKTARTLENDARIAGSRVENLISVMDQQKKTVGSNSADEIRARELDREARLLREQLETSTAKYQEALARQDSQSTPGDARVISRAAAPQLPSFPKKVPILAFATVAGFVLSLGYVVAAELLSGRAFVAVAAQPMQRPLVPGEVPVQPRRARSAALRQDDFAAEDFADEAPVEHRATDAAAEKIMAASGGGYAIRVIATNAPGKSSAADIGIELARTLALQGRTVLLDLSGEIPGEVGPGLAELLAGHASFAEAIQRDHGSRLHLVTTGAGRIVDTPDLDVIIDALSQTYEYIVLATRSEGEGGLALALAPAADFVALGCSARASDAVGSKLYEEFVRSGTGEVIAITDPVGFDTLRAA